jgi:hypothetical protein
MVCTSAFGVGNDYPHTRFVIHAGNPFEMIGYIQEVARAGRDKEMATCILVPTPRESGYLEHPTRRRRLRRKGCYANLSQETRRMYRLSTPSRHILIPLALVALRKPKMKFTPSATQVHLVLSGCECCSLQLNSVFKPSSHSRDVRPPSEPEELRETSHQSLHRPLNLNLKSQDKTQL